MDERAQSFQNSPFNVLAERLESRVLLSTATFAPPGHYPFDVIPRDTAIADFNNDGAPDMASLLPDDNDIAILLNNGDGTFVRGRTIHDGTPHAIAAVDFNHDGNVDIAVLGFETGVSGGTVEIFMGNGDGTFTKAVQHIHLAGAGPSMQAVDVN